MKTSTYHHADPLEAPPTSRINEQGVPVIYVDHATTISLGSLDDPAAYLTAWIEDLTALRDQVAASDEAKACAGAGS